MNHRITALATILFLAPAWAGAQNNFDVFDYDHEHWKGCQPLTDPWCARVDYTRPEYPPTHWSEIKVTFWPLDEAPCDGKFCHVESIPLKEVCGDPGPGEFAFDGKEVRVFLAELCRYKWVGIAGHLNRGPGPHTTANPPPCGVS